MYNLRCCNEELHCCYINSTCFYSSCVVSKSTPLCSAEVVLNNLMTSLWRCICSVSLPRDLNIIWFPGNHSNKWNLYVNSGQQNQVIFSREIWGRGSSAKELLSKSGPKNVQAVRLPEPLAYLQWPIRHPVSSFANLLIGHHPQWVIGHFFRIWV